MGIFAWTVAAVLASWAFNAVVHLVWRPRAITRRLRAQGVAGPDYRFFSGSLGEIKRLRGDGSGLQLDVSSHDFLPIVQPHFRRIFWGTAKHMLGQRVHGKTGTVGQNENGLVLTDSEEWKRHLKVVHPAFNMDKLKMMTVTMSDCAQSMMSEWDLELGTKGGIVEIELSRRFEELTADVISHTAFGSSYKQGKQVFLAQRELQFLAFSTFLSVQIPGFSYLLTKKNVKTWSLDKKCKTFFFAGHDTTSHLLTWTMFLLSARPEWQERLREEVETACGGTDEVPTRDMLNKLKLLHMFLLETLRLYSPVSLIQRKAGTNLELGGIKVPKGAILTIPIATIHRDKEVWGPDADEFRPERFEKGASRAAKHPNALLSFSSGPRSCIGQNFAMIEAKTVVAMILQRFSFELSPKYVHAPTDVITLCPKYGLPMIFKSLKV
uniref:Cytochrome P450 n=1 Tax=Leersia perrieri TaxID=77586 RepID=A0A0D9WY15_9ORYZ